MNGVAPGGLAVAGAYRSGLLELISRRFLKSVRFHLDFVRYPGPGYGQGGLLGVVYRSRGR